MPYSCAIRGINVWASLFAFTVAASCTTPTVTSPPSALNERAEKRETGSSAPPEKSRVSPPSPAPPMEQFSIEERMLLSTPQTSTQDFSKQEPQYSFRSQDMPLADALRLFARAHGLNIVVGPDIEGIITVDFRGLPLERAMVALLDAHGFFWEKEGDLIRVHKFETRNFTLDYIRLVRGGTGRNKAQVTSGTGGGGQDAGEVTLDQQDSIKFWEELETQIKVLLSQDGRLVINRLSGTIQVTDLRKRVQEVAKFLASIRRTLYRQVEIEARIYEIALTDDYALGINWNEIAVFGTDGLIKLTNIIATPAGGITALPATTSISFKDGSFDVLLEALSEQGDVRVVSQPRVLTLNNQPALIKVGTDESFFTSTVTQGVGGSGNIVTENIRTVTSGLVLSVTPQISEDGWIMMDVTPIITRITDTVVSPNGSTAPETEVKQSGGLVRIRNGQMVIIGGLIQNRVSETERKVPLLGDIPGLGRLFKGTYRASEKTELVIFLSPSLVEAG